MTKKPSNKRRKQVLDLPSNTKQEKSSTIKKIDKKVYEKELQKLQVELVKLQRWIRENKLKVVVPVSYTHLTLPTSDLV